MTDLAYLLAVLRRQSGIELAHGLLGGAVLVVWAVLLFGGPA